MSAAPLTRVKPSLHGRTMPTRSWDDQPLGVFIGPREFRGYAAHNNRRREKRPLARYAVYLQVGAGLAQEIGYVEQYERRGERPTHKGSRIVSVTGWPIEWAGHLSDYTPHVGTIRNCRTRSDAVAELVQDWNTAQEWKQPCPEVLTMLRQPDVRLLADPLLADTAVVPEAVTHQCELTVAHMHRGLYPPLPHVTTVNGQQVTWTD